MDVKMEDAGHPAEVLASLERQRTPEKRKLDADNDVRMSPASPLQIRPASTSTPLKSSRTSPEPPSSPLSPLSSIGTGTWSRAASIAGEDGVSDRPPLPGSANAGAAPPAKRRKLTPAEKLEEQRRREEAKLAKLRERQEKEREREEKARQKEEEKRIKDEEKRAKDEEKRVKDEEKRREREEKQRVKDEEKRVKDEERRAKEEERQRKEEELRKKQASQLKLASFFTKAKPSTSPSKPAEAAVSIKVEEAVAPSPEKKKSELSDYEKTFQAFEVRANVQLAPFNRFTRDREALLSLRNTFDKSAFGRDLSFTPSKDFAEICNIPPFKKRKMEAPGPSVRELMSVMQSSESSLPSSLGPSYTPDMAMEWMKAMPIKLLKFCEDVRPPYHGTLTKIPITSGLERNPFERSLPITATNYDYDSEAEWVEQDDEDGEDLNSEGEEELEDDEEDMDEFLDDENEIARIGINDIGEPVCSGICWENSDGVNQGSTTRTTESLERYRFEVLLDATTLPINPFPVPEPPKIKEETGTMKPPRAPLHAVKRENNLLNAGPMQATLDTTGKVSTAAITKSESTETKSEKASGKPKKALRHVAADDLDAFKRAVEGSDLTKTGLIEILKKQFPKEPKDAIKATLETIAKRVGTKEVDKKWVLIA